MIDANINNPKSPKYHVKRYLDGRGPKLREKVVLDIPAGNGATTELLLECGARVEPFDLFPEYFMLKDVECKRADIAEGIPVAEGHADLLVCQEGIEHFGDQPKAFREFNRVLKLKGELLLTTPSASNLAAKLSYLLFESETAGQMPPNEIDDIWMSGQNVSGQIYHGHIFLIGLQKLRLLAKLSGFRIKEVRYVRLSKGSLFLFPFFYPLILVSSYLRYFRSLSRQEELPGPQKSEVYREQLKMNISPKNLLNKHTFVIFEKEKELKDLDFRAAGAIKPFGRIM